MDRRQDQFQRPLRVAEDDLKIIGLVLTGLRGKGFGSEVSDFDVLLVVRPEILQADRTKFYDAQSWEDSDWWVTSLPELEPVAAEQRQRTRSATRSRGCHWPRPDGHLSPGGPPSAVLRLSGANWRPARWPSSRCRRTTCWPCSPPFRRVLMPGRSSVAGDSRRAGSPGRVRRRV